MTTGDVTPNQPPDHPSPHPLSPSEVGPRIEGYTILREIHRGGQGVVYEALQQAPARRVAIKVMKEGPFATPAERARFKREAQVLAQLEHPSIVDIHVSGQAGGCSYFVMDYITGEPLDRYLDRHRPPLDHILRLFGDICQALNAAHLRGIIHRDLKPSNILIDAEGQAHILDFGLAKLAAGELASSLVTATGHFLGSLPWAAPEQAGGSPSRIDTRSDVYAVGVMLYRVITGQFPYDVSGDVREVLNNIATAPPPRPSRLCRHLPGDVETIILTCLAKEREGRYQNAGELARDIERYLGGEPIQARRTSLLRVARARLRRTVSRERWAAMLTGMLVVVVLTQLVVRPLVYVWTPLNMWYERLLALMPVAASSLPEEVAVIGLTEATDVEALAHGAGLEGVSTENLRSLRRLHGAMMERLAAARPAAVVWDITFASRSSYDEDWVSGAKALRDHGIDVVVATRGWHRDYQELPQVSPVILPHVRCGAPTAEFMGRRLWHVELVMQRGTKDPLPSLALLAFASAHEPGTEASLFLDHRNYLGVRHFQPAPQSPGTRRWIGDPHEVRLSAVTRVTAANPDLGLQEGDYTGDLFIKVPADNVLGEMTRAYHDVFLADSSQLQRWFSDKIVLLADLRNDDDRFEYPDGRRLPGCYGHAAAIHALATGRTLRWPNPFQSYALIIAAVIAGTIIGAWLGVPLSRFGLVMITGAIVVTVLCLIAYQFLATMCHPLVPAVALCGGLLLGRSGNRAAKPTPVVESTVAMPATSDPANCKSL